MTLYLIGSKDDDELIWVALERDMRLYCYLPASGRFHFNRGLSADWIWDRELRYQEISAASATELIEAGEVGALDQAEHREVLSILIKAPSITLADAVNDDRRGVLSADSIVWCALRSIPEPFAGLVRLIGMSDGQGLERFDAYAAEQRRYWATVRQGLDLSLEDKRAMLGREIARLSNPEDA